MSARFRLPMLLALLAVAACDDASDPEPGTGGGGGAFGPGEGEAGSGGEVAPCTRPLAEEEAIVWTSPEQDGFSVPHPSLWAGGGLVLAGLASTTGGAGRLIALDPVTGAERWTVEAPLGPPRHLAIGEGKLVVNLATTDPETQEAVSHGLMGIDPDTGAERWRRPVVRGRAIAWPSADLALVVHEEEGEQRLIAIDPLRGDVRWTLGEEVSFQAKPIVAGDLALVQARSGLVAVQADGRVAWRTDRAYLVNHYDASIDEARLLVRNGSQVSSVDRRTGQVEWTVPTDAERPSIALIAGRPWVGTGVDVRVLTPDRGLADRVFEGYLHAVPGPDGTVVLVGRHGAALVEADAATLRWEQGDRRSGCDLLEVFATAHGLLQLHAVCGGAVIGGSGVVVTDSSHVLLDWATGAIRGSWPMANVAGTFGADASLLALYSGGGLRAVDLAPESTAGFSFLHPGMDQTTHAFDGETAYVALQEADTMRRARIVALRPGVAECD